MTSRTFLQSDNQTLIAIPQFLESNCDELNKPPSSCGQHNFVLEVDNTELQHLTKMFIKRQELEPVIAALLDMSVGRRHRLLFTITGMAGSGKSSALFALHEQAPDGVFTVHFDILDLVNKQLSRHARLYIMLQGIAAKLGCGETTGLDAEQPGIATLNVLATRISDALSANNHLKLLLTLDNADKGKDARALVRSVEDFLFTRLRDITSHNIPALVVVASVQEIDWQFLYQESQLVMLAPFDTTQIQEQLGFSSTEARNIYLATGGLPVANRALWDRWQTKLKDRTPEQLFQEVFKGFVEPLLQRTPDTNLRHAIKAAALLDEGFDVTQFMRAMSKISYMKSRFNETGYGFYYQKIDLMYVLGVVRFSNEDARYHMEPNLAALLKLWNRYEVEASARLADQTLIDEIYQRKPSLPEVGSEILLPIISATEPILAPVRPAAAVPLMLAPRRYAQRFQEIQKARAVIGNESAKIDNFVGRETEINDLADYWCRLGEPGIDIVFLQGDAGSGKTYLLKNFLQVAAEAAKAHPSSGLVVPLTTVIDLEFSAANRVGRVRRRIIEALEETAKKVTVQEDLDEQDPTSAAAEIEQKTTNEQAVPSQSWVQTVMDSFAAYFSADDEYNELRNDLRKAPEEDRPKQARAKRDKMRFVKRKLDNAFATACRNFAHQLGGPGSRRRVLLAFDTYDYPVRSGASASQFIAEIAARLAGDYFIVIACRPPIQIEDNDNYIRDKDKPGAVGDLRNYLPDDIRDQARVIALDHTGHPDKDEIILYYEQQPWFEKNPSNLAAQLAASMAEIIVLNKSLPVLLSLLEYYAGVVGSNQRLITATEIDGMNHLLQLKQNQLEHKGAAAHVTNVKPYEFEQTLIEGLFHPSTSPARRWALTIMAVADLGVNKDTLAWICPPDRESAQESSAAPRGYYEDIQDWPRVSLVWQAIQEFAYVEKGQLSTLVKVVDSIEPVVAGGTEKKKAYKLHDYISNLYGYYSKQRWLAFRETVDDTAQFGIELEREKIAKLLLWYVHCRGQKWIPKVDQAIDTRKKHETLANYQEARSSSVYYGIRLAAIRHEREHEEDQRGVSIADKSCPEVLVPAKFKSSDMARCLNLDPDPEIAASAEPNAATTAHIVFSYLYGKITREVGNFLEYGFAEMLAQEVRYYLYNRYDTESRAATKSETLAAYLTLPIINRGDKDGYVQFQQSRELYYAALATWEYASELYPIADPWIESHEVAQDALPEWRNGTEWNAITHLFSLEDQEDDKKEYQKKYGLWLYLAGFAERAHDAFALLGAKSANDERADFLVWQTRAVVTNPEICYRAEDGSRRETYRGFDAAHLYLIRALEHEGEYSEAKRAKVYYTYGWLNRQLERLAWQVAFHNVSDEQIKKQQAELGFPAITDEQFLDQEKHGALWYYYQALALLKDRITPTMQTEDVLDSRLRYAQSLAGYGFVLMLFGEHATGMEACDLSILQLEDLMQQPQLPSDMHGKAETALAHSYSTRGEIARNDAEGAKQAQRAESLYLTALDDYKEAATRHRVGHREWHSLLAEHKALCEFMREVSLYKREARQDLDRLIDCIEEMLDTLSLLLPKDKPNGYRRLGRMFRTLADMSERAKPVLQLMDADVSKMFNIRLTDRYIDPLASEFMVDTIRADIRAESKADCLLYVKWAYISMQTGYLLATKMGGPFNKLVITSDTVSLLARFVGPKIAAEFYEQRKKDLPLSPDEAGSTEASPVQHPILFSDWTTEYRAGRMLGLSKISIGMAYLREICVKNQHNRASLELAVANLIEGFKTLRVRSVHDRRHLRKTIADLRRELRNKLPDDDNKFKSCYGEITPEEQRRIEAQLAILYGEFKSLELGRSWIKLLRWMSLKLNKQLSPRRTIAVGGNSRHE